MSGVHSMRSTLRDSAGLNHRYQDDDLAIELSKRDKTIGESLSARGRHLSVDVKQWTVDGGD